MRTLSGITPSTESITCSAVQVALVVRVPRQVSHTSKWQQRPAECTYSMGPTNGWLSRYALGHPSYSNQKHPRQRAQGPPYVWLA